MNGLHVLFSNTPLWGSKGLAIVRITVGSLLIYHGQEVFNPELMSRSVMPSISNWSGIYLSKNVTGTPIIPLKSDGMSATSKLR